MNDLLTERKHMVKKYGTKLSLSYYENRKKVKGFELIDKIDLNEKLILDLGAYAGYVGWVCSRRGADVVLLDIFSEAFPEDSSGVVGDKSNLPFKDDSFSCVFCNDVLHHGDLPTTLKEIHRVLIQNGIFISTQEPCLASSESEKQIIKSCCAKEIRHGVDERRPTYSDYKTSVDGVFANHKILSGIDLSPAEDKNYGCAGIAIWGQK